MGQIEIISTGQDVPEIWNLFGGEEHFAENYADVITYLYQESRYRDIVHTVPGGPRMAERVQQLLEEKYQERDTAMPFDIQPIVDVMAALRGPDGCPWDKAQTHMSLRRYLIEEVHEMLDAIEQHDTDGIREELGDVLYQVVIHARIGEEQGLFSAQDIVRDITKKMIYRHPHVFNKKALENNRAVMLNWDRLKQGEQRQQHAHLLDGVVQGLPSLLASYKIQEKAAKVGFDWNDDQGVWNKVREEWTEFRDALREGNPDHAEEEAGDVLFIFANVCRHYHIEPECALHRANAKFRRRFSYVEAKVKASQRPWSDFSPDELDAFWQEAKEQERKSAGKRLD